MIIVTTKNLFEDVKELICGNDKIDVLVLSDTDPHHYPLSPEDIAKIEKSDLIVTTGHMDFEIKIREMIIQNELRIELVDPLLIRSIVIKNIPGTSFRNLHGVTYDPNNYKLLITEIYSRLTRLNPGKSSCYRENYNKVIKEIDKLLSYAKCYRLKALADTPHIQYAVEWLGVEIVDVIVKEHDLPIDPRALINADKLMRNKGIELVIVNYPFDNEASIWLNEKAEEYGIPILRVYDPNHGEKTLSKLTQIIDFLRNNSWVERNPYDSGVHVSNAKDEFITLTVALAIGIATPLIIIVVRKRSWF